MFSISSWLPIAVTKEAPTLTQSRSARAYDVDVFISRELVAVLTAIVLSLPAVGCGRLADRRGGANPSGTGARDDSTRSIKWDGRDRNFILHAPSVIPKGPDGRQHIPLVVVLHGGGATAENMIPFTGFNSLADTVGFAVLYPNGVGKSWNDGRNAPGIEASKDNVDDVGFISAAVDQVAAELPIDPERIYATGISNGAMMSNRLACERADRFAAVAPVAGSGPQDFMARCRPVRPVSMLMINGTADPLVPYQGGPVLGIAGDRDRVWSVDQTVGFWVTTDGCPTSPVTQALPDPEKADDSAVRYESYSPCKSGSAVDFYSVVGGGHTWPGGPQYLPKAVVGPVNRDFNATQVIWEFFESHPLGLTPTAPPAGA